MDLNSKSVEEKIRQYRVFKSCSQSTLMGLCEVANHPMSQARLCALASGFSGGIGGTFDEGTCGALTGALIALGFLEDDEIKIKKMQLDFLDTEIFKSGTWINDVLTTRKGFGESQNLKLLKELYALLQDKLDLKNWQEGIEKKLAIVTDVRTVFQHKVDAAREDILSVLIAILIMIELMVAILR